MAQQFRASVASLTQTLEGTVQHFVRCIKPNETKAGFLFEPQTVRVQLVSCSVQAAAEVSRAGWPYRASFFDMLDQFEDLMSAAERKLVFSGSDLARQELIKKLMLDAGFAPESYAIGRTKVFGSANPNPNPNPNPNLNPNPNTNTNPNTNPNPNSDPSP